MDEYIDHTRAQEIINWAVGAGALIKILEMRRSDLEPEEENELLNEALGIIIDNMPLFFAEYVLDKGLSMFESFEEVESMIEDFRREIDDKLG